VRSDLVCQYLVPARHLIRNESSLNHRSLPPYPYPLLPTSYSLHLTPYSLPPCTLPPTSLHPTSYLPAPYYPVHRLSHYPTAPPLGTHSPLVT
jgi:hypothetical protein